MPEMANRPDPDTRTPRLKCPPGATDCHFHLFGPQSQFPFDPDSVYNSHEALPETVRAMHKAMGISRGVIISGGGYGQNPAYTLHVLKQHPGYFRAIIIPPDHLSSAEIEGMSKLGVRGVRYVTASRSRRLPTILPDLSAAVAEHDWHVEFYSHGTDIIDHADRLLALPNRAIVIDHMGAVTAGLGIDQPAFKAILKLLDTGRFWVKLSGPMRCTKEPPPYPSVTPIARALIAHAPDRLVWGTDWPHVNMNDLVMPNDGDLIDLLLDWAPDEAVRRKILVDNPCALYGFAPPSAGGN